MKAARMTDLSFAFCARKEARTMTRVWMAPNGILRREDVYLSKPRPLMMSGPDMFVSRVQAMVY